VNKDFFNKSVLGLNMQKARPFTPQQVQHLPSAYPEADGCG
jgi:hypothetical protein